MSDALARARSHFLQGVQRFEQGRLDDAAQAFEAALALAPGRPSVLSNLGLTRFHQGRFEDAAAHLRAAAQADPNEPRASGHYDTLQHADVVEALDSAPQCFDLVIAADVFIYVGRLESVFEGVAKVLRPGGWLAFTVERAPDEHDVLLLPSLRHAHSAPYLSRLAQAHGLQVRVLREAPIREDQGQPVPGWYVLMQVG